MTLKDLHMTFDFAILKPETNNSMKTKKKNLKILTKTHLKALWST